MANRCIALLSIAPWLLCSLALFAQEDATPDAPGARTSKLSIHGFLSQAYAMTDGLQLVGIPEEGTTDYRNVALQFRYDMTSRDTLIVQFSHTRQGGLVTQPLKDDVEIDWAFYQHSFADGSYLKVGRVPMPIGIYNEIRDVGTLLPFYAPPFSLYYEDQFASERIDGLVVGRTFRPDSPWKLDVDVYGGGWTTAEARQYGTEESVLAEATVSDAFGTQIWLSTPVPGLRFGLGAHRFDVTGGLLRAGESDRWEAKFLSIDGDFDRFVIRSEVYFRELPLALPGAGGTKVKSESYYVQLGYRIANWAIFVQVERAGLYTKIPFLPPFDIQVWKDNAVAVNYKFRPDLVVKLELHDNEGFFAENVGGYNIFADPPGETRYGIASLSVSF